jgi:hypothetical protein
MLLFDDSKKLEKALGEEAASVIAHVLEKADENWRRDLATKADIENLRDNMATKAELLELRVEMQAMKHDILRWMVGGFIALGAFLLAAMAYLRP